LLKKRPTINRTGTVLLTTASYDVAAEYVQTALSELGVPWFRLNTDYFPTRELVSFDPASGVIFQHSSESLRGSDVSAVWYRRLVKPELPGDLSPGVREFSERESRSFLTGVLACLPTTRWLSSPNAIALAEKKPYQLKLAYELGFRVPETRITNNSHVASKLAEQHELVAKAVSSGYFSTPDGFASIFTSRVRQEDLAELGSLTLSPVTFQEFVHKALDIRVTIVGNHIFATEIHSQSHASSAIDWRATDTPDIPHLRHELPSDVAHKCMLMVKHLGLSFGAIDLALTPGGDYIFFEINPNGEWVWIEEKLGFPISRCLAEWLSAEMA
jgi:glutathione synthase/RimK-type ligase-like ATP-grasp enzyme